MCGSSQITFPTLPDTDISRLVMGEKESLNLTVERKFKKLADKLAKERRRSISGLFEDLVEEEKQRREAKQNRSEAHD